MAISRAQQAKQLLALGGRIGLQEGGGIMPRLNQLGSGVSSAEQMLQGINQRLESAESSLSGGGDLGGLPGAGGPKIDEAFFGNISSKPVQPLQGVFNNGFNFRQERDMGRYVADNDPGGIMAGYSSYQDYLNAGNDPISRPQGPQPLLASNQFSQVTPPQTLLAAQQPTIGIPAAGYADGGIASLQDPRQGYFLGKLVKKAKRAVKKITKSPIGKAALLGGLGYLGAAKLGGLGGLKTKLFGSALPGALGRDAFMGAAGKQGSLGLLGKLGLTKGGGSFGLTNLGKIAGIGGLSGLAGLLAAQEAEDEEGIDISDIDRGEGLNILDIVARARKNDPEFRFLPGAEFTTAFAEGGGVGSLAMNEEGVDQKFVSDEAGALPKKGGGVTPSDMGKLKKSDFDSEEDYQRYLRQLNKKAEGGPINLGMDLYLITKQTLEKEGYSPGEAHEKALDASGMREYFDKLPKEKDGGRIGKQEGGIMDLGGMEMDLRGGGFVPLGAKEKADDVPARLSKNEFVMTADAVRAAGGGSIDKGADKMYNLMKDLESRV